MENFVPKNKKIFISAIFLFVCFSLYLFGFLSVKKDIVKIEEEYKNTESVFFKDEKIQNLKRIAESNKEKIEILRNFFIKKGDEVKFIEEIEAIGRKYLSKFEINSIDVKQNEKDSLKEDIVLKMEVSSSWIEIIKFIDALEKSNLGILVKSANINNMTGNWSGILEFVVYREK